MSSTNFKLPTWLKSSCITASIILLGVSCIHASWFLWKTTPEGWLRWSMVAMVCGLFIVSHLCAHLFGHSWKQNRIVFCFLFLAPCIVVLEGISIATTSAATNNRVMESTRTENHASPEYTAAMNTVNNYQNQVNALNQTVAALHPVKGRTARQNALNEVALILPRLERAQRHASSINVSTTAKTYDDLESATGLSASDVSLLIAFMMSVGPIVMAVAVTVLSMQYSKVAVTKEEEMKVEVVSPKKSRRPNLKAVTA